MQKIALRSLQEYSAEDINRRHFQMQFFLALYGLTFLHNLVMTSKKYIYTVVLIIKNIYELNDSKMFMN